MWELDYKESWALKNECFWTVVLEKTLESPLDCKEIQPVHPKGDQCWIFTGRTDVEAEPPVLWAPDVKSWLTGKDPDAGKDGRREEKGTASWGGWLASPTRWTWVWVSSGSWWWTGRPGVVQALGSKSQTRPSGWTELNWVASHCLCPAWSPFFSVCVRKRIITPRPSFPSFPRSPSSASGGQSHPLVAALLRSRTLSWRCQLRPPTPVATMLVHERGGPWLPRSVVQSRWARRLLGTLLSSLRTLFSSWERGVRAMVLPGAELCPLSLYSEAPTSSGVGFGGG